MSTKSTPPIAEFYSLIASGHGIYKYVLLFGSDLSTVPDDSTVEHVDTTWTHLLSYHWTIVRPELISHLNDTLPRSFFFRSLSDSKGQPAILLALMVKVVKIPIDFSFSISFNVQKQLLKHSL